MFHPISISFRKSSYKLEILTAFSFPSWTIKRYFNVRHSPTRNSFWVVENGFAVKTPQSYAYQDPFVSGYGKIAMPAVFFLLTGPE
jgi:hypothetical protein